MAYATTVSRRRMGNRLRLAREAARLTAAQTASALGVSQPTVSRMERGQVGVRPHDLGTLIGLYQISGTERDALVELNQKRERGWWTRHTSILRPGYYAFISFEAEASSIVTWEPILIPGFWQTEAYFRAMMRGAGGAVIAAERFDALLEVRLERQRHLASTDPAFDVILDESVLHRVVGDRVVMAEQHQRLIDAASEPRTSIRVIPYERGAEIAGVGGITALGYDDGLQVVWGDTVAGDSAMEEDHPELCLAAVDHLRSAALDEASSLDMIKQALERSA